MQLCGCIGRWSDDRSVLPLAVHFLSIYFLGCYHNKHEDVEAFCISELLFIEMLENVLLSCFQ